jgi:hypothetical protein
MKDFRENNENMMRIYGEFIDRKLKAKWNGFEMPPALY